MQVKDSMRTLVTTVSPDTLVSTAYQMMTLRGSRIRHLPVVTEQNVLVGILTDRDVRLAGASDAPAMAAHELLYVLEKLRVRDIMTRAVVTVRGTTPLVEAGQIFLQKWQALRPLVGIGGSILFVSALLYFLNMLLTCVASHAPAPETPAFAEALSGPEEGPAMLDCWRPWLVFTAVLLLLAYGHPLVHLVSNTPLNIPGMRVW